MDFNLSDDQQQIVDAIGRLCQPFDADYWLQKDTDGGFPHDFHQALAQAGWLGIAMPEEYGGAGLGITEAALVMQTVAESGAALQGAADVARGLEGTRNFIADLVQHVRDTYRTQRGKEREMQREMERVQRQFRGLFGVNPLLGDGDMDRNSVTEDDLYMFTNFCDIIAPKHRLDGYIAWPMASTSQEWDRRNMFHPELMLCNPMSKIRELQPGEELQLLERLQQPAPTAATTLARTMK